jgi:hypothetical protein
MTDDPTTDHPVHLCRSESHHGSSERWLRRVPWAARRDTRFRREPTVEITYERPAPVGAPQPLPARAASPATRGAWRVARGACVTLRFQLARRGAVRRRRLFCLRSIWLSGHRGARVSAGAGRRRGPSVALPVRRRRPPMRRADAFVGHRDRAKCVRAPQIGDDVAGYGEQPAPECARAEVEMPSSPPRPYECLLHYLLGPDAVTGQPQSEAEQRSGEVVIQRTDERLRRFLAGQHGHPRSSPSADTATRRGSRCGRHRHRCIDLLPRWGGIWRNCSRPEQPRVSM